MFDQNEHTNHYTAEAITHMTRQEHVFETDIVLKTTLHNNTFLDYNSETKIIFNSNINNQVNQITEMRNIMTKI